MLTPCSSTRGNVLLDKVADAIATRAPACGHAADGHERQIKSVQRSQSAGSRRSHQLAQRLLVVRCALCHRHQHSRLPRLCLCKQSGFHTAVYRGSVNQTACILYRLRVHACMLGSSPSPSKQLFMRHCRPAHLQSQLQQDRHHEAAAELQAVPQHDQRLVQQLRREGQQRIHAAAALPLKACFCNLLEFPRQQPCPNNESVFPLEFALVRSLWGPAEVHQMPGDDGLNSWIRSK